VRGAGFVLQWRTPLQVTLAITTADTNACLCAISLDTGRKPNAGPHHRWLLFTISAFAEVAAHQAYLLRCWNNFTPVSSFCYVCSWICIYNSLNDSPAELSSTTMSHPAKTMNRVQATLASCLLCPSFARSACYRCNAGYNLFVRNAVSICVTAWESGLKAQVRDLFFRVAAA